MAVDPKVYAARMRTLRGLPESFGVLRAVRGRWSAPVAVRAADDAEGVDLRVRDGGGVVPGSGAQASGGCGVSGVGGGELSESPHAVRVSAASSWGFQADVRSSRAVGSRDRCGELRQVVDRRDEGSGERIQAQGDELFADARGGETSSGRDRGVVGSGAGGGRGEASGEGAHGQKAGDRGGPGAVRRAQVAVGGADRMDQGGAGFPAIQRAGPEQGPGRMGRMGSE